MRRRTDFQWPEVRNALERVGAAFSRVSNRENRVVYQFASGVRVAVGPEHPARSKYGMQATPGAMSAVFKAAHQAGVSRDALQEALEAEKAASEKGARSVEATVQVRKQPQASALSTNSQPKGEFELRTRDILDELGIPKECGKIRDRIAAHISLKGPEEAGEGHYLETIEHGRKQRRYDLEGAVKVVSFARSKLRPEELDEIRKAKPQEEKTPAPRPKVASLRPEAPKREERAPMGLGDAILLLCRTHDVSPVWSDGLSIDLEATVLALANSLR